MTNELLLPADEAITCPDCGAQFSLRAGIAHSTIEHHQEAYQQRLQAEMTAQADARLAQAEREISRRFQATIDELKDQVKDNKLEAEKFRNQIEAAKAKAAQDATARSELQLKELSEELEEGKKQLKQYRDNELTLRREKNALERAKSEMELEVQRRVDEANSSARESLSTEFRLKEAELRKKISDAQAANEDLKRKLEQGSNQLQGEVLELALEELLNEAHPQDNITPVAKGARGADILQVVRTHGGTNCGTIIWETKRAANWSNAWVQKLKDDQRAASAEIAILVTNAFPKGLDEQPFVAHEGVWLVHPVAVVPVSCMLREILLAAHRQKAINVAREEKAELIYNYLCSPQFAQRIRAIVDAYKQAHSDLASEKAAFQKLWKKREAQLTRITDNVAAICGDLQGLAGNSMPLLDGVAAIPHLDDDDAANAA